jgi:hypothetical protein
MAKRVATPTLRHSGLRDRSLDRLLQQIFRRMASPHHSRPRA